MRMCTGLRGRFTEFYVEDIFNEEDLRTITTSYLQSVPNSARFVKNIVSFYLAAQERSKVSLADGANHRPHYSLRTLCRSLEFAKLIASDYGVERALYEGEPLETPDRAICSPRRQARRSSSTYTSEDFTAVHSVTLSGRYCTDSNAWIGIAEESTSTDKGKIDERLRLAALLANNTCETRSCH